MRRVAACTFCRFRLPPGPEAEQPAVAAGRGPVLKPACFMGATLAAFDGGPVSPFSESLLRVEPTSGSTSPPSSVCVLQPASRSASRPGVCWIGGGWGRLVYPVKVCQRDQPVSVKR